MTLYPDDKTEVLQPFDDEDLVKELDGIKRLLEGAYAFYPDQLIEESVYLIERLKRRIIPG